MENILHELSEIGLFVGLFIGVLGIVFIISLLPELYNRLGKQTLVVLKNLVEIMYPGYTLSVLYGTWMILEIDAISIQIIDSQKLGYVQRNRITLWDEKLEENVRIPIDTRKLKEALEKTGTWQLDKGSTFATIEGETVVFMEKGAKDNVIAKVKKADLFRNIERVWAASKK